MTTAQHAGILAGRRGPTLGDYLIPSSLASRAPAWALDIALIAGGVILLILGAPSLSRAPVGSDSPTDVSRPYLNGVFQRMKDRGCKAAVMGCTEIPLLVDSDASPR